MRDHYTFVELSAGPQLVNAARERALKEFKPSDDVSEEYVRQCIEIQEGTSIRVHRDRTAEASGPVVFSASAWKKRLVLPNYAPPIRFTSIDGPVTISYPAEFAALPENFDGKVFLRLDGGYADIYKVRAWLAETLDQMMRAEIHNVCNVGTTEKPGKRNSPPRC
jgi:hypothetical protein